MGLDIEAYSKSAVADGPKFVVDEGLLALTEEAFPGRTKGLAAGPFFYADCLRFRAGSYSGYGEWRDWLAKAAGFESAKEVWSNNKDGPLSELINFSDCEGYIGPAVSAKLANDFDQLTAALGDDGRSKLFAAAFRLAAKGGFVRFC